MAQGKIYRLVFEGREGLEVRAATCSFGQLLDVGDEIDRARAGSGLAEVRDLVDLFASKLRSWNCLAEDKSEIPITSDGLLSLDVDVALDIVLAWVDVMTSMKMDRDLGKGSTSGARFPEESIPMTVG
jgi:hypothetical protein